jgi:hypothetical protein
MGKGSGRRPLQITDEEMAQRWANVFKKEEEKQHEANSKRTGVEHDARDKKEQKD